MTTMTTHTPRDFENLVLDTMNYHYELRQPRYYNHMGTFVEVIEFTVETAIHNPDVFAVKVTSSHGEEYPYYSGHIASWPHPVRSLYQDHLKAVAKDHGLY